MTRGELKQAARNSLCDDSDTEAFDFWSDDELSEYAQEAVDVFARKTKCLRDTLTEGICVVPIEAGAQHIKISELILAVERVKAPWRSRPLEETTLEELSELHPGWEEDKGAPVRYLLDYSSGYLSLDRALELPDGSGSTLRLTVRRMPLAPMVDDLDEIPLPAKYHYMLRDYMLFRAFSKQDAETYNPAKAQEHLARFQGMDEARPEGHVGRALIELEQYVPNVRRIQFF